MIKLILKTIAMVLFGALGALVFMIFFWPYLLTNSYFENYQFVKDYKEGKIVVNKTEQVYIQETTSIETSIEKVKASLVVIQTGSALSSGFITTSDGNIITLASAVSQNSKLFLAGQPVEFKVVKKDTLNNVALLKIDKTNLQTLPFVNVGNMKLGQRVFLIAPASGLMDNWLANEGIVKEIGKETIKTNMVEKSTTASAPLFDVNGQLIGLTVVDTQGSVSAILINKIQQLLGI